MQASSHSLIARPPVVTVMGHIDHGKSTLLDYIRKSAVTETEAGGITQHLSAYEVEHTTPSGEIRRITFLDTPGHEAFQHLRSRGSSTADLAILVVAADDGVKPQTLEALKAIEEAKIPYLVALTKIDKENVNIERAKASCLEHGIYLEGLGGTVPYVPISSKTGEGIPALLDILLLAADLEELTGDPSAPASGLVIESHCDPKRGISSALIVKDGTVQKGEYIVAGPAMAPVRILEDFRGKTIARATFSSPVMVVGFSDIPPVGAHFVTVPDKKTAQAAVKESLQQAHALLHVDGPAAEHGRFQIPVVIKTDVVGSLEAIVHELRKFEDEKTEVRVVREGVGAVTEGDIQCASGNTKTLVIGFNVGADSAALDLAERMGIEIASFGIIYEISDWFAAAIAARRPTTKGKVVHAKVQVLKCFSYAKKAQTIGCRVLSGTLSVKDRVQFAPSDGDIHYGHVVSLRSGKTEVPKVEAGNDCGAQIEIDLPYELAHGHDLEAFTMVEA